MLNSILNKPSQIEFSTDWRYSQNKHRENVYHLSSFADLKLFEPNQFKALLIFPHPQQTSDYTKGTTPLSTARIATATQRLVNRRCI